MDTTPNFNLGKPLPTEQYDVGVPNANMDAIDSALGNHEGRLDTIEANAGADPTSYNDWFTAAAGWTISQTCYVHGAAVFGRVTMTRTGAAIASDSDGNIANVIVATWAAGKDRYKPIGGQDAGLAPTASGPLFAGYVGDTEIRIGALLPTPAGDIATSDVMSASFSYLRDIHA